VRAPVRIGGPTNRFCLTMPGRWGRIERFRDAMWAQGYQRHPRRGTGATRRRHRLGGLHRCLRPPRRARCPERCPPGARGLDGEHPAGRRSFANARAESAIKALPGKRGGWIRTRQARRIPGRNGTNWPNRGIANRFPISDFRGGHSRNNRRDQPPAAWWRPGLRTGPSGHGPER